MKNHLALSAALAVALSSAHAQISVVDPSYSISTFYTHSNSDAITSFDRGANGALYYQTVTSLFSFGGLYQSAGGLTSNVVPGSSALFPGASVVSIGPSIYFNNSDVSNNQYIYQYKPAGAGGSVVQTVATTNYSLAANQGRLFIAGAPASGINHIYYSAVNGVSGNLDPALDLGEDAGSSGPLTFDAAGNLFYAPGFGDSTIYRWSKAEVDAAIANPGLNPLGAAGHQFASFAAGYGGTSMVIDGDGNLLLTLTNFNDPSLLEKFGVNLDGTWTGAATTVLTDVGRLGELRMEGGTVLLSEGNQIFALVPEPSAIIFLATGGLAGAVAWRRRRRG